MTTYTVTAEGRTKLRSAIRTAIKRQGLQPNHYGEVSGLFKSQLIEVAEKLGLNIPAILAFGMDDATSPADVSPTVSDTDMLASMDVPADTAAPQVADTATDTADTVERVTEQEEPAAPVDDALVQQAVTEVFAPMARGDFDGVKQNIAAVIRAGLAGPKLRTKIIERTHTVRVEVPSIAPPREGEAPFAVQTGTASLRDLFHVPGRVGDVQVTTWKGPLSAKVDPAWRWQPDVMATIGVALSRSRPVMLHGARGTGKSSLAEQIAAATGREFVRISCTDTTEAQELVGKHGPDGKGGISWIDGQLTQAIRRPGCVILVDEPSVARAGAIMILQSLMDSARVLFISETGERVAIAPGTVIFLADNTNGTGDETGAYEGTGRLNAATLDRPAVNVRIGYMNPDDEARMVAQRTGCNLRLAMALVKFANQTRQDSEKGQLVEGLSPRRVMSLAELLHFGCSWEVSWRDAVLNSATAADREHFTQLGQALVAAQDMEGLAR